MDSELEKNVCRALAASLIRSADVDLDKKVTWSEVEMFSDFDLARVTWQKMVAEAFQSVDDFAFLNDSQLRSSILLRVLQGILYDQAFLIPPTSMESFITMLNKKEDIC